MTSTPGTGNIWVVAVSATDPDGDPVSVTLTPTDPAQVSVSGTTVTVTDTAWAQANPGAQISITATADDGHGGTISTTVPIGTVSNAAAIGYNDYGQTTIPALPAGVTYTQVAAGYKHTVLLRSDGTAVAVGLNNYGQTTIPAPPAGVTYTGVAAGDLHTVLLRSDGTAVAIGNNDMGQTTIPALPAGVTYTGAAAGPYHTVLLRSNGTAVAVGYYGDGQTGIPALPAGVTYTQVAAGGWHTVLLRSDGTAVAVGSNGYGQTGIPALPAGVTHTGAAAGLYHTVLLRSDGTAVAVGNNGYGQTGIPALPGGVTYTDVAAGRYDTVLLRSDGTAVAVGDNGYGQTSIPALPGGVTYTDVAGGTYHTVLLSAVDAAPVAGDDAVSTNEDTPLVIAPETLLANDSDPDGDELSITAVWGASHGITALGADGTITYTPHANYTGTDTFHYLASHGTLGDAATVTVTVTPVNDAPVATGAQLDTAEDTALSGNVLDYVTDVDTAHAALTAALGTGPQHAQSFSLNPDGSFAYTPHANYNGPDSFTYTASDGSLTSNEATVAITVNPVNDAPVAVGAQLSTAEDTELVGNVLDYVTDVDTAHVALTAVLGAGPAHAQAFSLNADGSFAYTPAANYSGPDSFTYTASDGDLTSNEATVAVTVNPVNDAPVVDVLVGAPDPVTGKVAVTLTASDPDGDPLTVTNSAPSYGSVSVVDNQNGTWSHTYTPNPQARLDAYNTPGVDIDNFTATVTDGHGGSTGVPVTVPISPTAAVVTATIPIGAVNWAIPKAVAATPDRVYVTNNNGMVQQVTVIDAADNSIITTIPVGYSASPPTGIAVSGNRVYVTTSGGVTVINTADNSIITTVPVTSYSGADLAVSALTNRLYVTSPGSVTVISTITNSVVTTIPGISVFPRGVAVSTDGSRVYVANYNDSTVTVIDAGSNAIMKTISLPAGSFPIDLAVSGNRLYVANFQPYRGVTVIDTATDSILETIPAGNNQAGVAAAGDRIYVTVTNWIMQVIDTDTNTVIANVPVGARPEGVATIGNRVYVANNYDGTVSVISVA